MKPILAFILMACLSACSSGNGQPDAGDEPIVDAGGDDAGGDDAGEPDADAADGGDPGDVDTRPDYDPAQSFLLTVPDETSLCFGFCQGRTWRQALDMIGRIDLLPGYYVLPRQEGFHRAELVDRVIFGPEHDVPQPTAAAGEIQAEGDGEWQYTFRKDFGIQGDPYHVEVQFLIRNPGAGWPAEVVVESGDYFFESSAKLTIRDGQPIIDDVQAFGLCDLPEGTLYTATITGGDQIVLDVRSGPYMTSCLAAGETSCLFLTNAQVQLGSFQQEISDRLRLVYVGSHHNWYDEYLILLDPPAGNTHAVWVDAPDFMGNTGYVIQMDASFNEVSRDEITDWQQN